MESPRRQLLPEDLAQLRPGPRLAAALAGIDPARLTAGDAEIYLRACYRQVSHDQARFMEAMVWFGLCRPAPDDVVAHDLQPSPAASDEVRASLRWTRQAAERQFYLALDLQERLPRVQQALLEGRIDLPRARVLADWTRELTPEQADRICGALLPDAPAMTTGELVAAVKQMAIAIDPDWAKRRYEEAVRSRRVVGHRNPDGTATLSGLDLPLDEAAAASARIETLARRVKAAGEGRRIDQIRADLFLRLLDGAFTGWDDEQIIAHLATRTDQQGQEHGEPAAFTQSPCPGRPARSTEPSEPEHTAGSSDPDTSWTPSATDAAQPTEPDATEPHNGAPGDARTSGTQPDGPRSGCTSPSEGAPDGTQANGLMPDDAMPLGGTQPDTPGERGTEPGGAGPPGSVAGQPASSPPAESPHRGRQRPAGVELRVRLSTLLGLDRHPAEIAGWGHTHAERARAIAAAQTGAQWRYAICDEHGALLHDGLITGRPHGYPARAPLRGIVEIQIPLALLRTMYNDPHRHPEWADVIAQINADLTAPGRDPGDGLPTDAASTDPARRRGTGPPSPEPDQRADGAHGRDRRFPSMPLRRSLQVRDRTCGFPGCRMPARHSDLDHIRQWLSGGPTQGHNLTSLCRHDHRLKDTHGWRLSMGACGTLRWTSRLGLTYTVRRTPLIIELPTPAGCRPAPTITSVDDPEPANDTMSVWTDRQHPPGHTAAQGTDDRPPPLADDETPPF